MSNPWGKFFWADWESDPALKLCSFAAQGLWMRMLCIAASHDPIGYVAVAGRALDARSLARMTGGSEPEVAALLEELDQYGVFSRDRTGKIMSRRMIRDAKKADNARKNGKKGGNPTLGKQSDNSGWDNPPDNPPVKAGDKPQKPEARSQIPPNPPSPGPHPDLVAVIDEAGMSSIPPDHQLLAEWKALGADMHQDILPTVRRIAEQVKGRDGRAPFKLKLFDAAIRQKLAEDAAEIERLRRITSRIDRMDEERSAVQ